MLLIGGTHDGEHIETMNRPSILLPKKMDYLLHCASIKDDVKIKPLELEEYRQEIIRGKNASYAIYLINDMTVDMMLDKLIANYRGLR